MAKKRFKLKWRGKKIEGLLDQAAVSALSKFGLMVEAGGKKELRPGHGLVTGTARRSIHAAGVSYNYENDDVEPGTSTPEKGLKSVKAQIKKIGAILSVVVGSGLRYAMALHQGHGSFEGYHFLLKPYDDLKGQFPEIYAEESQFFLNRDDGK